MHVEIPLRTIQMYCLKKPLKIVLLSSVLLGLGGCAAPQNTKVQSVRWEYRIEQISDSGFEERMNVLGKQGWEVVTARRSDDNQSSPLGYEVIFKRPTQ